MTDGESADICSLDLTDELMSISALLDKSKSPTEVLTFISCLNIALNLAIAIRIFTSISVASGERSFSKLKLIKNFLHSTTTQDRLNGLPTLAIKHELAEHIDVKDVIKKFTELKVRRKHF